MSTPRQLLRLGGERLPENYRRQLGAFQYGAGSFKVDYALSQPIPWTAHECLRAATVHLGGSLAEVVDSESSFTSIRPFVLLVQPSLLDPTRAPAGKHTAWAYCHVPFGSTADHLGALEAQIERFAPGFAECVLQRTASPPAALESWNANLVGGDLSGGGDDAAANAVPPDAFALQNWSSGSLPLRSVDPSGRRGAWDGQGFMPPRLPCATMQVEQSFWSSHVPLWWGVWTSK